MIQRRAATYASFCRYGSADFFREPSWPGHCRDSPRRAVRAGSTVWIGLPELSAWPDRRWLAGRVSME